MVTMDPSGTKPSLETRLARFISFWKYGHNNIHNSLDSQSQLPFQQDNLNHNYNYHHLNHPKGQLRFLLNPDDGDKTIESDNPTSPIILEQDNEEKVVELNKTIDKPSLENQPNSLEKSKFVQNPPYPEILTIEKSTKQSEFDFLGELKNFHVRIPLFQSIKDVPIYAKSIRELCLKKP
jgi:hypothetical protein